MHKSGKAARLEKVTQEILRCSICRQDASGRAVPGEGSADASVMFVGEAPGRQEAATGRPFVGRSGKLLHTLIVESGLTEEGVYITSPVKYLPDSGTPSKTVILHGKTHFDKQVAVINPEIVVLLGSVASVATLNEKVPVMKEHGKVIEKEGRKYFITLHPAAALRFPPLRKILKEDFEKLKNHLKKLQF